VHRDKFRPWLRSSNLFGGAAEWAATGTFSSAGAQSSTGSVHVVSCRTRCSVPLAVAVADGGDAVCLWADRLHLVSCRWRQRLPNTYLLDHPWLLPLFGLFADSSMMEAPFLLDMSYNEIT
jgi:hypothetical protein